MLLNSILVVDDEESMRIIVEDMLTCFGYNVFTAADGESALAVYRQRKTEIDLVLLDLMMPGMSGMKCLEELLKIDPEIRVLMTSGCTPDWRHERLSRSAVKAFITKPYEIKDLLDTIRKILEGDQNG